MEFDYGNLHHKLSSEFFFLVLIGSKIYSLQKLKSNFITFLKTICLLSRVHKDKVAPVLN
jgi:hypothetical protein